MRIEVGSPEFKVLQDNGKIIRAFLNGEDVSRRCIVADEETGLIERCVLDANGRIQVDPNDDSRVWTEEVRGIVRIEIADAP